MGTHGNEDGGLVGGGRRRGDEHGGARGRGGAAGTPGSRTLTEGLGRLGGSHQVHARIDHARALVEIVRGDLLPALRAAIAARTMNDARSAARAVRRDLAEIDRDLREARRITRDPEDLAEIAEVRRSREALRFEVEPVLAQAPPAPPSLSASEPILIAHGTPLPDGYMASERENSGRWNADLDERARPQAGELVELSSHRISALDPPAEWDEHRATIDDPGQAVVQRKASGYPCDDIDLPEVAAAGVAGTGGRLPHLDAIQRSFAAHDVTDVSAHVGGTAATAARAIGAEAYATGNHVAFAAEPSLFVAAHEAAHVVQQRAGVHLLGGVGQAGDAYEQHADAVAARVVAGKSAESLLDATGNGGPELEGTVQRKEAAEDASDEGVRARRGREVPDAVVRDAPPFDPLEAQAIQDGRDGWRPLILVGKYAREGLVGIAASQHSSVAVAIGKKACGLALAHLAAVVPGKHEPMTRGWFVDAVSTSLLLIESMKGLGAGDASLLQDFAAAIAKVQEHGPESMKWPMTVEDAEKRAGKEKKWTDAAAKLGPSQLRLAGDRLDEAIETFRAQKVGEDGDGKLGGSSEKKAPVLYAGADDSAAHVEYVLDAIERGEIDDAHPKMVAAVEAYLAKAQRFVYWAMTLDPVEDAADRVASVCEPLAKRFGKPALVVADPIVGAEDLDDVGTLDMPALVGAWAKLFAAQAEALDDLAKTGTGETNGTLRDEVLMEALAGACVAAPLAYVGAALGAKAVSGMAESAAKAGWATVIEDATKEIAAGIVRGVAARLGLSSGDVRQEFFESQKFACDDAGEVAQRILRATVGLEARRSPDGRAMIAAMTDLVSVSAADIAALQKQRGVQAWAEYMSRSAYGTDEKSGGVDLNKVGRLDRWESIADVDNRVLDRAPVGLLELYVRYREGEDPVIEQATVEGLGAKDKVHLAGLRIGDLSMPVMIIGRLKEHDHDLFEAFQISRNAHGAYWLNEATEDGERFLQQRANSHEEAAAIRRLFGELADMRLPELA